MLCQQARELGLLLLTREPRDVDDGELNAPLVERHLTGRGLVAPHEHCAQRLLTPEHLDQRGVQRIHVERARHAPGERRVVGDATRRELVEEQQLLLRERQRVGDRCLPRRRFGICAVQGCRLQRVMRHTACLAPSIDDGCELPQRGLLEQGSHRNLSLAALAHLRHNARGEQRVSTQIEEVVLGTNPLDGENVLPHLRDGRLGRRLGLDKAGVRSHPSPSSVREAPVGRSCRCASVGSARAGSPSPEPCSWAGVAADA